jgi:hypothetical protein
LAVWVFEVDPQVSPGPQSFAVEIDADFSADGVEVAYSISGIPAREEDYYVMGIFDDDESGWAIGPGAGDLGAVGEAGLIIVEMKTAGTVQLDLDLFMSF